MKKPAKSFDSQATFAAAIGVSSGTLSRYLKRNDWPAAKAAPWTGKDVELVKVWRTATLQENRRDETSPQNVGTLNPWQKVRVALALEKLERMKLDRAKEEGKFHDAEICQRRLVQIFIAMRQALCDFADGLPFDDAQKNVVREGLFALCRQFAGDAGARDADKGAK